VHFARVIGTVVCTEKVPSFHAQRMLLLEPTDSAGAKTGKPLVAIDLVSAAPGQRVFYVRGREAANALPDADNPADAAIVGIVDAVREGAWEGGDHAARSDDPHAPRARGPAHGDGARAERRGGAALRPRGRG
jgi:ethanolamine utilization protein EutN